MDRRSLVVLLAEAIEDNYDERVVFLTDKGRQEGYSSLSLIEDALDYQMEAL